MRTPISFREHLRPTQFWRLWDLESTVLPWTGNHQHGFGCQKVIPIPESMSFEIRGEFFNIFNHTQFNNPHGNISSSNFGVVTSARDPRIGQVSAKFIW